MFIDNMFLQLIKGFLELGLVFVYVSMCSLQRQRPTIEIFHSDSKMVPSSFAFIFNHTSLTITLTLPFPLSTVSYTHYFIPFLFFPPLG